MASQEGEEVAEEVDQVVGAVEVDPQMLRHLEEPFLIRNGVKWKTLPDL